MRGSVGLVAFWLLAVPCGTLAQPATKIPRIGFLGIDSDTQAARVAAFRDGLHELGYVDGRNIIIEYQWAEGHIDRLPKLASELVRSRVDIIVTAGESAVSAARNATSTIPIVAAAMNNPVELGFVTALRRPGGNVTGLAFQDADLSTKRLDLFRLAVPRLKKLAVIWHDSRGAQVKSLQQVDVAAKAMGLKVLTLEIRHPDDFATAIAQAKAWGADGLFPIAAIFLVEHRAAFIEQLRLHGLPATCPTRIYVIDGCLMSYGVSLEAMFHRSANYVDRILKGADPANLAIEQPREFEFVINGKAAQALKLTIPQSLKYQMTEPLL
jgi:putative tryptophan/tyrosine transport system substrate-binding protein